MIATLISWSARNIMLVLIASLIFIYDTPHIL